MSLPVAIALAHLLDVLTRHVVGEPLGQLAWQRRLHLDVEPLTVIVPCPDIEDGQFVFLKILPNDRVRISTDAISGSPASTAFKKCNVIAG